jgi:hypothetical protein
MASKPDFATKFNYKAVAASQSTAQLCGEGGFLHSITVVPASSTPQAITLFDGTTGLFTIPIGAGEGTKPYTLTLDIFAESTKGFNITTGASVAVICSGNFGG